MQKELYHSAPEDEREEKEMLTYALLEKLGIDFYRADHDAAATIEACMEVEKVLGCEICKNLLLCNRQCTDFYMLLMPGSKPFKTKDLSKQIGTSRLSFASARQMQELVNITPGSLSVLGLQFDKENKVKLIIDRDLLSGEYLGCHPCVNTSSLKIKLSDILEKFLPCVNHTPEYVTLPDVSEEQ